MKENFSIKSKIISGTVTKTDCENGANIVIDIKIHGIQPRFERKNLK